MPDQAHIGGPERLGAAHEPYITRDRGEILGHLRALWRARSLVTAYVVGGDQFFVTTVLAVNPPYEELILDAAPGPAARSQPREGTALTVVAFVDRVKLQFQADHLEVTQFEGSPALRVRLPAALLRLQRRDAYRVRTPVLRSPLLHLPAAEGRPATALRVADISCGGLSLDIRPGQPPLEPFTILPGSSLELPEAEPMGVTVEVRHTEVAKDRKGQEVRTCGCRFVDLPGPHATAIQRYINQLEREQMRYAS